MIITDNPMTGSIDGLMYQIYSTTDDFHPFSEDEKTVLELLKTEEAIDTYGLTPGGFGGDVDMEFYTITGRYKDGDIKRFALVMTDLPEGTPENIKTYYQNIQTDGDPAEVDFSHWLTGLGFTNFYAFDSVSVHGGKHTINKPMLLN